MTVNASPFGPKPQFMLSTGLPAVGYKLFWYVGGSVNTKQNTYVDSTGAVANTNPIVMNALGEPSTEIWLTEGLVYKAVLAPANDTDPPSSPVWTIDGLTGINDSGVVLDADEWISGPAPTFVGATQFTLVGDQTSAFHPGRRVRTSVTAGTSYGTIRTSVFGALTTVTIDTTGSNPLDAGLSAVSYGILSADNPSAGIDAVTHQGGTIASAATLVLNASGGDYNHISGSTTVTAITLAQGRTRTTVTDGAVLLTHGASLLLGGSNILSAAGDTQVWRGESAGVVRLVGYMRASGAPLSPVLRSYLAGLGMSTAGGSATMTIAAGVAANSTNVALMTLAAAIAKTTSAWAVGTGNGGLDTGAIANSTQYHFHLIQRLDTGVVDALISLSPTAPTMPANYTIFRRIGSMKTNGSAQWIAFSQVGDNFLLSASVLDVDAANPGTAAVSRTLSVPTGIQVDAVVQWMLVNAASGGVSDLQISSLDVTDEAPSVTVAPLATISGAAAASGWNGHPSAQATTRTNTSAQVRSRLSFSDASVTLRGATLGWIDRRGRDS